MSERKALPAFIKPPKKAYPTRFIFVSNADTTSDCVEQELIRNFEPFGELDDECGPVFVNLERHVCYVCYKDSVSAQAAMEQAASIGIWISDRKVSTKYAAIARPPIPPPEPECISTTADVVVPGLYVLEDFISRDEEERLLEFSDAVENRKTKWKTNISRRVQHYGYEFNYQTLLLDKPPDIRPMPTDIVNMIADRLHVAAHGHMSSTSVPTPDDADDSMGDGGGANSNGPDHTSGVMAKRSPAAPLGDPVGTVYDWGECGCDGGSGSTVDIDCDLAHVSALFRADLITQLTINEYYPDQGIAAHTDTAACFGPVIYILSVGSGLVMTFTETNAASDPISAPERTTRYRNDVIDSNTDGTGICSVGSIAGDTATKKHVELPARSLAILSGPARFSWTHGIAPRKFDKGIYTEPAETDPRAKVVNTSTSATDSCSNAQQTLEAFRSGAVRGGLLSSQIEEDHVYKVYDEIAQHWHHTRGKRKVYWHRVKCFLDELPSGSLVADVGCGDGKYFGVNPNIITIGCDRSPNLLHVSKASDMDTFCCDAVKLPFKSGMFDAVICIAVFHHLATEDRRLAVLRELVRIIRPGGTGMVQAWALEQETDSKRKFKDKDVLVPWKLQGRFAGEGTGGAESPTNTSDSAHPDSADGSGFTAKRTAGKRSGSSASGVAGDSGGGASAPIVFQRFCHVYEEGELEGLVNR